MSGSINIGKLHLKKVVRNMSGQIIDLLDETDGGWIIRKGQVVNQEKYEALLQKEKDRREAALASTQPIVAPNVADRAASPSKVDALEKKVESMEGNIAEILKLLKK